MTDQSDWHDHLKQRFLDAMEAPLIHPGSQALVHLGLEQFPDPDSVVTGFVQKITQTISDGQRHDAAAVPTAGGVTLWIRVWPGSHTQMQPERVGTYLNDLYGQAKWLVGKGLALTGLLEIDVYVIDPGDPEAPVGLELEYSFLPGPLVGGVEATEETWNSVVLNQSLLTAQERQALEGFGD